jgi:hypothetical protein
MAPSWPKSYSQIKILDKPFHIYGLYAKIDIEMALRIQTTLIRMLLLE